MNDSRDLVHLLGQGAERAWDAVWQRVRPPTAEVTIIGYGGYGNPEQAVVLARLLRGRRHDPTAGLGAQVIPSLPRRVGAMVGRFATDELVDAEVLVRVGRAAAVARSDDEGYIRAVVRDHGLSPSPHPQPIDIRLVDDGTDQRVEPAEVLIIDPAAPRMVVSDIDDTVLVTGATSRRTLVVRTLTGSAQTRRVVPGMAGLLRALRAGRRGGPEAPVVYVSASPWNLYDFLVAFLATARLPAGPLLLRDYGIDGERLITGDARVHKRRALGELLAITDLPLVLVGDTGEHDPAIFAELAAQAPSRIERILLRDIGLPDRRAAAEAALQGCEAPWMVSDDPGALLEWASETTERRA